MVARDYLDIVGAQLNLDAPVQSLSTGEQRLAKIGNSRRRAYRLLILDEPTASPTEPERDRLFEVIFRRRERDLGTIFISHFIDEAYAVVDYIVVVPPAHPLRFCGCRCRARWRQPGAAKLPLIVVTAVTRYSLPGSSFVLVATGTQGPLGAPEIINIEY